jgi:hypothetical protein
MNNNVFFIDPTYIKYRRMWKEDRWKFSGDLVKLTAKQARQALTEEEQYTLDVLNRVVDENDGKWLDGYESNGHSRAKKRG